METWTMAKLMCVRCQNENPGLEKAPWNDDLGRQIHASICQRCWGEWLAMQIKVINEYRLSLGDPNGQKVLTEQMKLFLNLGN
jgi:Fe-S cluster biosynthesis and repair protein YggX